MRLPLKSVADLRKNKSKLFFKELIKKYENAYCDICMGSPRGNLLEHLVEYGDDNKILYGSDTPLTDPGTAFGRVILSNIPDSSKEKILGLNFKKLLENSSL